MKNKYISNPFIFILSSFLILTIISCKKNSSTNTVEPATPTSLAVYEQVDSFIYKTLYMEVSKVGTQAINYDLVFDTGSGGLVIDANGILPSSVITSSGFNFSGDSTVVDGITITNQETVIEYGDDNSDYYKVYGNLAYANITIGDANGNISITRLPFLLYYKATDPNGRLVPTHEFDVLGVSPQYDVTFSNKAYITSPFSYFVPGTGLTTGFKIAALGTTKFSNAGTYVPGVVTAGLTAADISSSSGFVMSTLPYYNGDGYIVDLATTVTYNNKSVSTSAVFDTGTPGYSYIQNKTAAGSLTLLPINTSVNLAVNSGFTYGYTTSANENLTYIENPNLTGATQSIISIEFFLNNEYMANFSSHQIGLKNN